MSLKITISECDVATNPQKVIHELCLLTSEVMAIVFKGQCPSDCFCEPEKHFVFDTRILRYIQTAVQEKIDREGVK